MKQDKRNDGKTAVSFRMPIELEKIFHKYCVSREDRISKSDLFTQLVYAFLKKEGIDLNASEMPKADASIYE